MNIIFIIIIFGLIIIIHELGHFLLAKKNGITVTEFSIGMGPRLASFVRKGTRYSIKALPFGGSCMMLGEDETIEDEGAFHKKGVWARISVIVAGPLFNFFLAYLLSLFVIGSVGVDPARVNNVETNSPAAKAGIQSGDTITRINKSNIKLGREIETYFQFKPMDGRPVQITYERDGVKNTVDVNPVQKYLLGFNYSPGSSPVKVETLIQDFPFHAAGIQLGDTIVAMNGTRVQNGTELMEYIGKHPLTKEAVTITYLRGDVENTVTVTPKLHNEYVLGFDYNVRYEKVSMPRVFQYSVYEVRFWIVSTIKGIGHMIRGKVGLNEIAGPVGIVTIMNDVYEGSKASGLRVVLINMATFSILLSANLGVMNLLPIPALDGGRLVFLLLEAVRGKPINREKEAMVHFIGIAALMLLMVFVLFNDIRNIFS